MIAAKIAAKDAEDTRIRERQKARVRQKVAEGQAAAHATAATVARKDGRTPLALTAARLAVQQLANAREAKAIRAAKKKLARETARQTNQ